jgi:hypothetical protein
MECWNSGMLECWNVEALAEIPLRREKNGIVEEWKNSTIRQFDNERMEWWNSGIVEYLDVSRKHDLAEMEFWNPGLSVLYSALCSLRSALWALAVFVIFIFKVFIDFNL